VGLVTCPYRGCSPKSLAARLEALGIGADFIPSALVSLATEEVRFAFGSTIALPRSVLEAAGGFAPLADELADDYRLAEAVRRAGYRIFVSDYVVDDVLGSETFRGMWTRRLRWARTVRSCRPAGYAGSVVTHGAVLGLVFLAAFGFHAVGWCGLAAVLATRFGAALWIARWYTDDPNVARFLPLLPLSDLLAFALFVGGFCGSTVTWRGERFRLLADGKIVPLDADRRRRAQQDGEL
jgi:ceramide glucosyltransferase